MLYMMHYITNINNLNIASQLPLFMKNLKTLKETNNFPEPCTLSIVVYIVEETLYMKYNNVTACMKYF